MSDYAETDADEDLCPRGKCDEMFENSLLFLKEKCIIPRFEKESKKLIKGGKCAGAFKITRLKIMRTKRSVMKCCLLTILLCFKRRKTRAGKLV